jgi:ferredoxin-type protein NapG
MKDEIIDPGKRKFFKEAFSFLGNRVGELVKSQRDIFPETRRFLRPPGAVGNKEFLALCTRCDECLKACPHGSIRKLNKDFDIADGTPIVVPDETPCYLCDDFPCVRACKEGALIGVDNKENVKMGKANINNSNCMAWGVQFCEHCVRNCPVPGAIYLEEGKPIVRRDICVGCGVCENICHTVNQLLAIKVVPEQ